MARAVTSKTSQRRSLESVLGLLVIDSPATCMYVNGDLEDVFVAGRLESRFKFKPQGFGRLRKRTITINDLPQSMAVCNTAALVEGAVRRTANRWCRELDSDCFIEGYDFGITNREGLPLVEVTATPTVKGCRYTLFF
ncbi:hypothetical protein GNI_065530 [Gregarina niphandrodes]|uniref:Uncharacterized protein n=1 Tax=Gregarina niphandrodes TaxID=110365 RepID=A0A023B7W3_GRENI|nr:hypothetical protein GNI_065530 [Gregarina niphandrodes]EZG67910.1 hypothetical protein GNI_065530 [Gregarina niphandrodes]|eukprot:XP_011130136.1 hypothetical protein GNI_065530 [Gregarina niphandrodes]